MTRCAGSGYTIFYYPDSELAFWAQEIEDILPYGELAITPEEHLGKVSVMIIAKRSLKDCLPYSATLQKAFVDLHRLELVRVVYLPGKYAMRFFHNLGIVPKYSAEANEYPTKVGDVIQMTYTHSTRTAIKDWNKEMEYASSREMR